MTNSNQRREHRSFTPEFKKQIVQLFNNGKRKSDIIAEYDLSQSAVERWIKQGKATGSF